MRSHSFKLSVSESGRATFIYDDAHADLIALGDATITRVSSVEPSEGGWAATMKDGTVLGPYRLREEALRAEVAYLDSVLFA